MKKALLFLLCALFVFSLAACGEKEVSNGAVSGDVSGDVGGDIINSDTTFEDEYIEDDESLMNIQDIIGFWYATSVYQSPRVTDSQYETDEDVVAAAQSAPVQISANEFVSPLFSSDNAVFKKVSVSVDSLGSYGIQVDEVLEQLVGDGEPVRIDIFDGDSSVPSFHVFLLNEYTMLYEGDGGYFLFAEIEESVG